jgi:hypothetical protein
MDRVGVDTLVDGMTGNTSHFHSVWFPHGVIEPAITMDVLPFVAVRTGHIAGHMNVRGALLLAKSDSESFSAMTWQAGFHLFDLGVGIGIRISLLLSVARVA